MQNLHRYFFYAGLVFNVLLTYDAIIAFHQPGLGLGVTVGTLVLLTNAVLLWMYSLSCHACRHLCGGHVKSFKAHPIRYRFWKILTPLNATLGDRVVIQPTPGEETTKSGIVIPDTAKEKPQEGKVLAVGPGRVLDDGNREQMDLKPGEKVLYAKYAGTEFKLDGEDLLIISSKDILAVVESRP
jgi:chaperonin GroES